MARRHDIAQILKILACVVLVGGLVMQICMLAAISSRTKATAQVNANIKTLSADKDNYNVKLARDCTGHAVADGRPASRNFNTFGI